MATFITQARFTKEGLNGMIAAPEHRTEIVDRLIEQLGAKLIGYYFTSGEYDILLIFEATSYENIVPALIVAAAGSGLTDLKTITALTSSEMNAACEQAGSMLGSYCPSDSAARPPAGASTPDVREAETSPEEAKGATAILVAEKKAMDDIRAGRPAPYYFTSPDSTAPSGTAPSSSSNDGEPQKS
jgi:uncharacterized protein with GYD domain